jgi:hypothetical protein
MYLLARVTLVTTLVQQAVELAVVAAVHLVQFVVTMAAMHIPVGINKKTP